MDLSNLTFDELLDAIRSDSGYQNAQAKKTNTPKAVVQEQTETLPEAEESTATEEISEADEATVYVEVVIENPVEINDKAVNILSASEEPEEVQEAEEAIAYEEAVTEASVEVNEEPEETQESEKSVAYKEVVIENPVEINDKAVNILSASESIVDPEETAEEVAVSEENAEDEDAAAYEAPTPDATQIFTPPATPLSLFETEQYEEEELPVWRMPDFTAQAYKPIALAEEEPSAEHEPTVTSSQEESIYTPSAVSEPIELVQPEETAEEEPIKVYTPPKPESISFGGFDIETDIASLFPDITEEDDSEPTSTDNIDKTRVIPPIEQSVTPPQPEPSLDKTRVIPAPSDDKTKVIAPAADDKTKVIPPTADDKTKAIDFSAVFERPGIVTTSNAYEKTSDLSALPHILPADELIDNEPKKFVRTGEIPKIAYTPKAPVVRHEEDEQMILPGFFDKEEIIRVDEDVVEEELKRTRSRKVDSFRLEGAEIDEAVMSDEVSQELAQGNTGTKKRRFSTTKTRHRLTKQRIEFTRPSDGKAVHSFIANKQLMAIIGAAVSGICSLILLITTVVPSVAEAINSGSGNIPSTYIISLVALLVAIGGALPACISGITCFFNGAGRPNSQTPVIIAAAAALIQSIVVISTDNDETYPLFALAATFLLCCCSAGNILVYSRTKANFAFLYKQGRDGLYSVRRIDNAVDANRVSQNVVMGDADIRYSGKIKFADRFMAYSLSSDSADDLCAKLVPILAVVSLVIAVIGGIVTKSFAGAATIFSGTICMGAPACALIAANFPLLFENKKLREDGAMISGYAAAFEYESTNAVAIDASELFPGENCNIHGMKTFNGVRVDDAVLTAASMLIAAGGPISSLFKNVIMEHNELLLKVDELKYEERLGLTGWIRNRRIFVGNRKLLENHNIDIPMSIDESKYVGGNRQIIYLADAGKIAAFFVVSYGRNKKIAEYLRQIENNGINILVRTTDSNINEKFIAGCFDLPLNSVKVVSNTAGEVLKNYSEHTVTREGAKLIHNGTAAAFLHAVSSASKLCAIAGKISTLQTFCMVAGLLLTVLIMIFSGPLSLTALPVCISQLVWFAIAAILPLFERE